MSLLIIVGKINYFAVLCLKAVVDIDTSTTLVCLVKGGTIFNCFCVIICIKL